MQKLTLLSMFLVISVLMFSVVGADIYGSGSGSASAGSNSSSSTSGSSNSSASAESDTNSGVSVGIGSDVTIDSEINVIVSGGVTSVILSDGREAIIRITSEEAKQTAEASLEIEDCSDCEVELTETEVNNEAQLVYEFKAEKEAKVFGIFKTHMDVEANVNAEIGQVVSVEKPWWSFLAVESRTTTSSTTTINSE